MEKTTSTGVGSVFPAEERARSVSKKTLCFSLMALPSGYAVDEVEKRVLVSLVAWPPVGGCYREPSGISVCGGASPLIRLDLRPGGRLVLGSSVVLGPQGQAFVGGLWSVRS